VQVILINNEAPQLLNMRRRDHHAHRSGYMGWEIVDGVTGVPRRKNEGKPKLLLVSSVLGPHRKDPQNGLA
jgi:hypothetical protein